jgi:hypothetical protein
MKKLILLFCCAAALAQSPRYMATTGDVVLSGTATALTLQQPASNQSSIQLESAIVYCSVACVVSQAQNGSAATSTAGTIRRIPPNTTASSATVWTASNVGAGTATAPDLHLTAAGTMVIDLSKVVLARGAGTGVNYTISIASITGTANIALFWTEQ